MGGDRCWGAESVVETKEEDVWVREAIGGRGVGKVRMGTVGN